LRLVVNPAAIWLLRLVGTNRREFPELERFDPGVQSKRPRTNNASNSSC